MGRALRALLAAVLLAPALLLAPVRPAPIAAAAIVPAPVAAPKTTVAGQLTEPPGMRLLVRFSPAASPEERARAVASVGGVVDREIGPLGFVRIILPGGANDAFGDGDAVAAYLSKDPAVLGAELDATVHLSFTPNDTYYLNDPFVGLGQWGIRKAQVDRAWDIVRGSANVKVAVIDTGVDAAHPDLSAALLPGTTFLSQPSAGCAFATNDDNGHGTHVSGIIAAAGNNGAGIAGVAFGARVLPIKALDCSGTGSLSDIAQGIVWATDQGARIINVSLGSSSDSQTLHSAVQYASNRNVLVVAAAGNCGTLSGTCSSLNEASYPAAYAEALGVGATDVDDTRAFFSTVQTYVGVAAPGRKIVSTTPTYDTYLSRNSGVTKSYGALSGTSQASPFVAGVAALLLSQEPALSARQLIDRLKSTADDLGAPGVDPSFGVGRVNALRAVSAGAPTYGATYDTSGVPRAAIAGGKLSATVRVTNTSSFTWSATGTNAVRLVLQWTDAAGSPLGGATLVELPADVAPGASTGMPVLITAPSAGVRTLRFDLLQGGVAFSTKGVVPASVAVTLGAGANGASYALPGGTTPTLTVATPGSVTVSLANTGTLTWSAAGANPVHLSYHWISATGTTIVWDGLRTNLPTDVIPGASVTVPLAVLPPQTAGSYTLRVDLVQEGVSWFSGQGIAARDLIVSVTTGFAASYQLVAAAPTVLPGIRVTVPVTVRNDGTATWAAGGSNPVHVAAHLLDASGKTISWDGERAALPSDVAPGASASVSVPVSAPLTAGAYLARVDLVREGIAWFSGLGVATADTALLVNPDFRASLPTGPITVSRAQHTAVVTVTNSSSAAWSSGGAVSVAAAAHWLDAGGAVLVWDGPRATLTRTVLPGESVTLTVDLGPVPAGAGSVTIDLVADGLRWFGAGATRPVVLVP